MYDIQHRISQNITEEEPSNAEDATKIAISKSENEMNSPIMSLNCLGGYIDRLGRSEDPV